MSSWDAFPKRSILIPDVLFLWFLISRDSFALRMWNWHQNVRNLMEISFECFNVNAGSSCFRASREIPWICFPFNRKYWCDSNENMPFQLIFRPPLWISHFEFFFHTCTAVHYCHIPLLAQIRRILISS